MSSTPATHFNRGEATVTADKTLAAADSGLVQNVTADGKVITLPAAGATTVGLTFTVRNGGAYDGAVGISVSPNASDQIIGNGFTAADNKDAINTKTTARPGDELTLVSDGSAGWFVHNVVGTWAREA